MGVAREGALHKSAGLRGAAAGAGQEGVGMRREDGVGWGLCVAVLGGSCRHGMTTERRWAACTGCGAVPTYSTLEPAQHLLPVASWATGTAAGTCASRQHAAASKPELSICGGHTGADCHVHDLNAYVAKSYQQVVLTGNKTVTESARAALCVCCYPAVELWP